MADVAVPTFKKRGNKASNIRKRPATPPPEDSQSESDYTDDEQGARVKRRRKDGLKVSGSGPQAAQDFSRSSKFSADRTTTIAANEEATRTATAYDGDSDTVVKPASKAHAGATESNGGAYKGASNYSSFIEKNPDAPNRQVGPIKAPTNIRTITVTDFAPDVCKDYKQTGFCGFGDSCKFLHAREDYKQGWQLDKEWEKAGKKKPGADSVAQDDLNDEDKMLEGIPFKCIICKGEYKTPVVTKCGHYFCERCAMTRYMQEKKKTCANCGADTNGTFNVARKLKELLEKKRKRKVERREKAVEAGEEVSSEEEDEP